MLMPTMPMSGGVGYDDVMITHHLISCGTGGSTQRAANAVTNAVC